MANYQVTPLVQGLPATVPFVGPETQERLRGSAFRLELGQMKMSLVLHQE